MTAGDKYRVSGMFLSSWVQFVERGNIGLPRFQRPYVWSRNDERLLLDSIDRGFPIGSMLVWAGYQGEMSWRFGEVDVEPAERRHWDGGLLLDGQQRTAALLMAADAALGRWIRADGGAWISTSPPEMAALDWAGFERALPSAGLFDSAMFWKYLREKGPAGEYSAPEDWVREISGLRDRFQSCQIPVAIIRGSEEEARELFRRVNTSGRPMSEEDLERAGVFSEGKP